MLCQDSEQSKHHAGSVVHALLFQTAQLGFISYCSSLFDVLRSLHGSLHSCAVCSRKLAQLAYKDSCCQVCICMCQLLYTCPPEAFCTSALQAHETGKFVAVLCTACKTICVVCRYADCTLILTQQ